MQQISKKVLLDAQEKKRKRRKNHNRFNYHNRVASNVVKTYYIYSVLERSVLLETKRRGKKIQASFMMEANSYKKVIGCIECSWRFLMASLLNGLPIFPQIKSRAVSLFWKPKPSQVSKGAQ